MLSNPEYGSIIVLVFYMDPEPENKTKMRPLSGGVNIIRHGVRSNNQRKTEMQTV